MSTDPETSAPTLTGAQRRFLRGRAHALRPVLHVGDSGIEDSLLSELDRALTAHELVKVRLQAPDDKKDAAKELARRSGAALCGLVGHTVILYRPDPEEPRLRLPGTD